MLTKYIALLAAGTLMLSACQSQPDEANVANAIASSSLSDITHEPLGNAVLVQRDDRLYATNMRTTQDGVRSLYQPGVSWHATLDWADQTSAIRLNSINSGLSGADTTSSLALDRISADQWRVSATFVSPSYAVNVYSRGQLVGTIRQQQGSAPVAFRLPWWWWWWYFHFYVYRTTAGLQQCSWEMEFSQLEVSQGSRVLRGDRVQIIEDAHESYGGFDEIQVLGNGDVTYLSEQVVPE